MFGNEPTERNKQRQNSCGWGAADEDDGDDADGDDADDGDDGEADDDHAVAGDLYSERNKDDTIDKMAMATTRDGRGEDKFVLLFCCWFFFATRQPYFKSPSPATTPT